MRQRLFAENKKKKRKIKTIDEIDRKKRRTK